MEVGEYHWSVSGVGLAGALSVSNVCGGGEG